MKKIIILIIFIFFTTGCSSQSILDFIIPDQEVPVISTSNLKNINQRMINFNNLSNTNISATTIGLRAIDNRDGDISHLIQYEPMGFYEGIEGYYFYVRYRVSDKAGNFNFLDIPYIVFEDVQINTNNYSEFLNFTVQYTQVSFAGLYRNLSYNLDLYVRPKIDFQLYNSTLRYNVNMNFSWTRRSSTRDQNFRYTYSSSDQSDHKVVTGSLQEGLYFQTNSIPLKFEYISLKNTDYQQYFQRFPCCQTTTYDSVSDSNVKKNYIVSVSGNATARIYYTDRV